MIRKIILLGILLGIFLPSIFSKDCGGDVACSCGDIITSAYTMNNSLQCENNGLLVRTHLDCNGNSIIGEGVGYGLSVSKMDKKTISNCIIENFDKGLILADIGTNDKTELNIISNSHFKDNTIGIFSGIYVSRNRIIDNLFENNEESIKITGGSSTLIVNNTFLDSTISMTNTGSQIVCENGHSNTYLGDNGSDCDCLYPQDKLYVNSDTIFCKGNFHLPNGIRIGTKVDLFCDSAHLIGMGNNTGMFWEGSEYSFSKDCLISNYTNGVEFKHKYSSNGYGIIVYPAKNNKMTNLSIKNVDIGVKTFHTPSVGDSKAEYIENSSIIGRNYSIYNPTLGFINARNNYYGTNDENLIISLFKQPEKIKYEPYLKKNKDYNLSFGEYTIKNNIVSIDLMSADFLIDNISILIKAQKSGEVVFEKEEHIIFSYENINTLFIQNDDYDSIYVQVDPNLEKLMNHDRNTQLVISLQEKTYFLDFYYGLNLMLENEITSFLRDELVINEDMFTYDKKLIFEYGIVNENIPYSFSITSSENQIIIKSHTAEGLLSAVISFLEKKSYFEENYIEFISLSDSEIGIMNYEYLNRKENVIWKNTLSEEFSEIISSALHQNYFTIEEIKVPINVNNLTQNYSIIKYTPTYSKEFISHINNSEYPIILGGGLWSDINSFTSYAKKLTQIGYSVYTIEITGGEEIECDLCYNYDYGDLTQVILPSLIKGIKNIEGVEKVVYIGHSNGARTFLDSILGGFISSEEIFAASLLGVPGSFEKLSLLGSLIDSRGSLALLDFDTKNIHHISQGDMAWAFSQNDLFFTLDDILLDLLGVYMNIGSSIKISTNLFQQYFEWITSHEDAQPGEKVTIKNLQLISGNPVYLQENDVIVPIIDQRAIFENIFSENKHYLETRNLHFKMTNDKVIFSEILSFLRGAY